MRALGIPAFGGPDVLQVVDRPVRDPGPGEVRIRVVAAAVNPTDVSTRNGDVADRYADLEPPYVPGMDAAGTVEALGEGVRHVRLGEDVMAAVLPRRPEGGAQAEQVVVPAGSVVPIPAGATLEQAATLPMNGLTAIEALDGLDIPAGGTLAITGGAGLLARYATVLAKERGLRVLADARPDEHDLVRGYGADVVVERGDGVAERFLAQAPEGVDGVLDTALLGEAILPAIKDGGGLAVVRGWSGPTPPRDIEVYEVWVATRLEDTEALLHLRDLAADGRIALQVADTYPPERAAEAHRRMEAGGVRGRLVIVF
ncbi:NADP-dependent oxidoreductase [Patulibacter sp. SYSU D01012]|uniref:quinone oxidoreductase family protein n=1 Tax=Patulibacter sp. SYSU D01012 TaxID=2817381 RepID=UPI001B313A23|nr:NADP-dependent oxidoreductase [Patulibacter sp. SYSU D01012]